jgi:two-component system, NarL family, nitrate/nitrite response regulator NarL
MEARVATVVVEPRFLVREALALLMGELGYDVIFRAGAAADVSTSTIADERTLIILGTPSAEDAASEVTIIREILPDSKLMLLLDFVPPADLKEFLTSKVDGCVPLFVSGETLSSTLHLILAHNLRVMVFDDTKLGSMRRSLSKEENRTMNAVDSSLSGATVCAALPLPMVESLLPTTTPASMATSASTGPGNGATNGMSTLRKPPLSDRETQVVDGLLKGHSNKVIARTCDITEATVKVHVRSILRKIRVGNRTQVAIWALESGYRLDARQEPH